MGKKKTQAAAPKTNEDYALELINCIQKQPAKVGKALRNIPEQRRAAVLNTLVDTSKYYQHQRPIPQVKDTPITFLMNRPSGSSPQDTGHLSLLLQNLHNRQITNDSREINGRPISMLSTFIEDYCKASSGHAQKLAKLGVLFELSDITFDLMVRTDSGDYSFIHYFLNLHIGNRLNETTHMLALLDFMLKHDVSIEDRGNPNRETPIAAAGRLGLTECKEMIATHIAAQPKSQAAAVDGLSNAAHNAVLANDPAALALLYTENQGLFSVHDEMGFTPILLAVIFKKFEAQEWLLNNTHIQRDQIVFNNYTLEQLIAAFADNNPTSQPNLEMLRTGIFIYAIKNNHKALFLHLVELWSPNYLFLESENEQSHSSMLSMLVMFKKRDYLAILLTKNIDKNLRIDGEPVMVSMMRTFCLDNESMREYFSESYIVAVLTKLFNYGFDVNALPENPSKTGAMSYIFETKDSHLRLRLFQLFLQHGANPNSLVSIRATNEDGSSIVKTTALSAAIINNDYEIAMLLCQHNAGILDFSEDSFSPVGNIFCNPKTSDVNKIKLLQLIEDKLDPFAIDNSLGCTLLEYIVIMSSPKIVQYVWKLGLRRHPQMTMQQEIFDEDFSFQLLMLALQNPDPKVFIFILKNLITLPKDRLHEILMQLLLKERLTAHLKAFLAEHDLCIVDGSIIPLLDALHEFCQLDEYRPSFNPKCLEVFEHGYQSLVAATTPQQEQEAPPQIPASSSAQAKARAGLTETYPDTLFAPQPRPQGMSGRAYAQKVLKLDLAELRASVQQSSEEAAGAAAPETEKDISWLEGAINSATSLVQTVASRTDSRKAPYVCLVNEAVLNDLDASLASKITSMRMKISLPQGDQGIKRINNNGFPEIDCKGQKVKFEWQLKLKGQHGNERLYGVTIKADEPGQPSLIYFCHYGPALHNKAARDKLMAVKSIPLPEQKPKASPPFKRK